jgi:glycosyltransferase involved in cell wall biosynthesis
MKTELNVTLLGFVVSDAQMSVILERDSIMPVQTHKFGWSLAKALHRGGAQLQLISSLPISNYPSMPQIVVRGERFESRGFVGETLGFINLIVFKHLSRFYSCLMRAKSLLEFHRTSVLLVHGVHSPYLLFALLVKGPRLKIVLVMTDPPGVVMNSDIFLARWLKRFDAFLVKKFLKRFDGIIGLTKGILTDFGHGLPGLLLPGFVGADSPPLREFFEKKRTFSIAYAGGLFETYGVGRLIEAVMSIESLDVKLILYGKGDIAVAGLEQRTNGCITYGGALSPVELAHKLIEVDLLINPRPSDQDFVRYSFPSKIIEYMASGIPVLTTRLPGIPEAYLDNMLVIEDETTAGIASAISDCARMSPVALAKVGISARHFINHVASEEQRGFELVNFLRMIKGINDV